MTGLCDGRVAIVTGGGRGIGREYCLMLAAEGAKVVVNDLGAAADGTGADLSPAAQVVAEIKAMGGEAVVNGADVSSWDQAKAMIDQAVATFGKLDGDRDGGTVRRPGGDRHRRRAGHRTGILPDAGGGRRQGGGQ